MAILFLDQEKGFDRVSHQYLWAAMRTFRIPRLFIKLTKALYWDGQTVPGSTASKVKLYQYEVG